MIPTVLIVAAVATALLAAACLRLESLASTMLAVYLALVVETTVLTTVLSPFRAVTRGGLAAAEAALLVAAAAVWWARGRPGLGIGESRTQLARLARDPVVVSLAVVAGLVLAYELALVLTAPPNNWDSLTYHLARAAAWAQHGGVYWIPNAPTARINEFQPLAEQEILFLFVATGTGALFALPQYLAQLAIVVGIYAAARRLGYGQGASAAAALLFVTLTVVALESTTAQNDLVAASCAVAATALILHGRSIDLALAGVAIGLGLGVKLTTAFVLPVLFALALLRGRRSAGVLGVAAAAAFLALGAWGYVRNLAATGHALGYGEGRVEHTASPSFPGSVSTAYRVVYRMLDLSGFGTWTVLVLGLAAAALLAAAVGAALGARQFSRAHLAGTAVGAAALLSPVIVLGAAYAFHGLASVVRLPVNSKDSTSGAFSWDVGRQVAEDYSSFGPLGGVAILAVVGGAVLALSRGIDPRRLVVALTLPIFVVLFGLTAKYNPWVSRLLIVPVAVTMPLCATLFRRRSAGLAIVTVAALTVTLAHVRNVLKPIGRSGPLPWELSQAEALSNPFLPPVGAATKELDRIVPASQRIGALLDSDDPSYLLYGGSRSRPVTYLPIPNESEVLDREHIDRVVIHSGDYGDASARLRSRGWRFQPLSSYWTLATRPGARDTPP